MYRLALALILILGAGSLVVTPARAATFVVDSSDDEGDLNLNGTCDTQPGSGVECTLRAAVQEANDLAGTDTINLPRLADDYQLSLGAAGEDAAAGGDLDVTESLTVTGVGQPVIDGGGSDRVFDVGPTGTPSLTLNGLDVRGGGNVAKGGGILVRGGSLALSQVTVAGNTAESASSSAVGGGVWIEAPGTDAITASTLSGNTADGATEARGGGIGFAASGVAVSFTNSTLSGNVAIASAGPAAGGAIASLGAAVTLTQNTVYQNTTLGIGDYAGSLLASGGSVSWRGNIVSAGVAYPQYENCATGGSSLVSLGSNLETPATSPSPCGFTPAQDRFAPDSGLAPLADRGGPTQTHALFSSSPALDAIPSCFPVTVDQRGEHRPSGAACEIGSFERQVAAPPGEACFGQVPTITASAQTGTIVGTPLPDVILASDGPQLIKGDGGKDLICAGKGNDRVYGGTGADRIAGGDGKDRLFGQGGEDALLGNSGTDLLDGGKGRDVLNGGGRLDNCRGGRHDKLKNC